MIDDNVTGLEWQAPVIDFIVSRLDIPRRRDVMYGDRYIVANHIFTFYDNKWNVLEPEEGFAVLLESRRCAIIYDGLQWVPMSESCEPLPHVSDLELPYIPTFTKEFIL